MSSSILRAIVARGGFNPLTDIPSAAYWDMHTPDAAYETLPGSTLATDQNDGIGAVLDIKRYKERIEKNSDPTFQSAGSDWSRTGTGWTFSVGSAYMNGPVDGAGDMYDSDFMPTAGTLYEAEATFGDSNGETCYFRAVGGAGSYKAFQPAPGATVRMLLVADGTVPIALRGSGLWEGTVTAFHVREIPGYHAIQDLAAAQPVLNIENGIRSALFDGVDDRLVIPNSKGAFNFLHDGTGGEFHTCVRTLSADTMYFASNGTASGNGFIFYRTGGGSLGIAIGNGSGTYAAQGSSTPGQGIQVGAINVVGFSLAGDTITFFKDGQAVGTVTASSALASGDSSGDINLGGLINSANLPLNGDMYSWVPVQGILSDYDRQRLISYMMRRAGI